jgi:FkbM family methyltransferase
VKEVEASAPIALFAYRRPAHLAKVLQALRQNPEASRTELFVFSDHCKSSADAADVEAVRAVLCNIDGFAASHVVLRDSNYGLARNITEGISEVLANRTDVIIVEDDIVVAPHFLRFMNDALRTYRDTPRVGSISGYCYPVSEPLPETYFIRGSDCWGWATWRDRWSFYNPDSRALLAELDARKLTQAFDFDGAMSFSQMLKDQIAGKNNSWAARWHASCYLRNLMILYPGRALARNIGFDGSGTHCTVPDATLDAKLSTTPVTVGGIPVEENAGARESIKRVFRSQQAFGGGSRAAPRSATPTVASVLGRQARRVLPAPLIDSLRGARNRWRARGSKSPAADRPGEVENHRAWGLDDLDRQIEKYLDVDGGYFVELGANDGQFQSNTLFYEKSRNWHGVLVEPASNLFLQCRKNRSPKNHIVCAACVSFDYKQEFVKMIYSNSMSVSLNVDTDVNDPAAHAELGRQFLKPDETLFTFGAVARTLNSILVEAHAPKQIDFFSLDVEGSELEVLKGVDHDAYRFRYMLVECRNLPRLRDYLETHRYRLLEKFNEHDYLFSDGKRDG